MIRILLCIMFSTILYYNNNAKLNYKNWIVIHCILDSLEMVFKRSNYIQL